jgi:fumarate reductase subunit D
MSTAHIKPARHEKARSNAPIFWSMFGAGGMLSALIGPALVFITGIAVPLGFLIASGTMDYAHMLAFARHWLGKIFIFAVIALFLWHSVHRIFHSLHDFGIDIHHALWPKLVCYGFALIGTLVAAWALLSIGF